MTAANAAAAGGEQQFDAEQPDAEPSLASLPTPILALILSCLPDAGQVLRAASSCTALWAAAAGPLRQVHRLTLSTSDTDLRQPGALAARFPCVEALCLVDSWHWVGCGTLEAFGSTLRRLELNNTCVPLLAAPSAVEQLSQLSRLEHLQLRRIVRSPGKSLQCRVHGSSGCSCKGPGTLLASLLQQNRHLTSLDLQGNTYLPDRLLAAAVEAASATALVRLNLSGCSLVAPHYLSTFTQLQDLDISGTAAADYAVVALAAALEHLTRLNLSNCRRVADTGIAAIAGAPAVCSGQLVSLGLAGLTRPVGAAVTMVVNALCRRSSSSSNSRTPVLLELCLSRTSGVCDAVLQALVDAACASWQRHQQHRPQQQQQQQGEDTDSVQDLLQQLSLSQQRQPAADRQKLPEISLALLELAGCNAVSSSMLLQLGECGALQHVSMLDLSDCEALRSPQRQPAALPAQGSSSSGGGSRTVLPQLLPLCGTWLRELVLDGCFVDDAAAAAYVAPLTRLSLVGCRGLSSDSLRQLLWRLPGLASLALGGAMSAWAEADCLPGLPCLRNSLTQLQLMRRPALRDSELVLVLAGAARLERLTLVGCHLLTDRLFQLAPLQPQLTQLVLTACDGIQGDSLARLRGLRHLRLSFCGAISAAAVQRLAVACTRLVLLELPGSLVTGDARGNGRRAGSAGVVAAGDLVLPQQGGRHGRPQLHRRLRVVTL